MRLNFKSLSRFTAFLCFSLAVVWIFFPRLMAEMWHIDFSYEVGLIGRRSGALFAGFGTIFFLIGNSKPSPARYAIVLGFVVSCLLLALFGVYEFYGDHANVLILFSSAIEITLAGAFLNARN